MIVVDLSANLRHVTDITVASDIQIHDRVTEL